jgi:hypothetical protein
MPKRELIDIAAHLQHETPEAYLIYDGLNKVWLPKKMVEHNNDGTFTMPEWLAKDKGLI